MRVLAVNAQSMKVTYSNFIYYDVCIYMVTLSLGELYKLPMFDIPSHYPIELEIYLKDRGNVQLQVNRFLSLKQPYYNMTVYWRYSSGINGKYKLAKIY